MRSVISCLLAALLSAAPVPAHADDDDACEVAVENARTFFRADYDPFSPLPTVAALTLSIRNWGDKPCGAHLTLAGDAGARVLRGPRLLAYEILTAGGQIVRNGEDRGAGVTVALPAKGTVPVSLTVRLAPGQIVPPGAYEGRLRIGLHGDGDDGDEDDGGRTVVAAVVDVLSRSQINLSGTNSPFGIGPAIPTLDFGTLTPGKERRAFLQLRSNARARISISSEHRGNLANARLGPDALIPYTLIIDGQAVSLAGGPFELTKRPALTVDGANYEVVARIGDFGNKFAGIYRDTVTMNVSPEE